MEKRKEGGVKNKAMRRRIIVILCACFLVLLNACSWREEINDVQAELVKVHSSVDDLPSKVETQLVDAMDFQLSTELSDKNIEDLMKLISVAVDNAFESNVGSSGKLKEIIADTVKSSIKDMDLSDLIDGTVASRRNAKVFYEKACDESSNNRNLFYLAAIIQDSTNAEYCWSYIEYLDEIAATYNDYYTLASLVETAILNNSYKEVEGLVAVYNYILSSYLSTYAEDNSSDLVSDFEITKAKLDKNFTSLWSLASEIFSYSAFSDCVEEIKNTYSYLVETFGETEIAEYEERYLLLIQTEEFLSSLNNTSIYLDTLKKMEDSDFVYAYHYVASMFDSAISAIVVTDMSTYGIFATLAEFMAQSILADVSTLNQRYDSLLLNEVNFSFDSLIAHITTYDSVVINSDEEYSYVVKKYEEYATDFTIAQSSLRSYRTSTALVSEISSKMNQVSSALYSYQYQKYQLWAAELLMNIKEALDEEKKVEGKLEVLYREGYFNIDSGSIIPKLKTIYDSLYEEKFTEKSSKTDAELLKIYGVSVKSIGEV